MVKLSGISMGCDCCYTNHADADQNLNENLMILLATAGCNYIMGMPLGDDIMLNYIRPHSTDTATVRQLLNLRPSPEFRMLAGKHGHYGKRSPDQTGGRSVTVLLMTRR
ncbi:ethanolamine ammonia-lyase subunit EutB [Escherichia coli]